jgi:hypothetical protein
MFQQPFVAASLNFLMRLNLNLQTRPKAESYRFCRVSTLPQYDVMTLNMIFYIQRYDVSPLNIISKLQIWSAIELI